jgi:hypothetical protein
MSVVQITKCVRRCAVLSTGSSSTSTIKNDREQEAHEEEETERGKRPRLVSNALNPSSCWYHLLHDIIVEHILGFVGVGHYRFVAGTNRQLCRLYTEFLTVTFNDKNKYADAHDGALNAYQADGEKEPFLKTTSGSSIVASISCANLCLKETHETPASLCTAKEHPIRLSKSRNIASSSDEYYAAEYYDCINSAIVVIGDLAATYGQQAVLQWARSRGYIWDTLTCVYAAQNGHLELLQWARKNGCEWDATTSKMAAQYGHLDVLKWAQHNGLKSDRCTWIYPIRYGHLEVLKWVTSRLGTDDDWKNWMCTIAASRGQLEILKWGRLNGCSWNAETCSAAALSGSLEVLKWLHESGCEWDSETMENAAMSNDLEIVKYAYYNGCDWHPWTSGRIARNGNLEMLKWALRHGCEWDDYAYQNAAAEGHLVLLQWAHENGCAWDDVAFEKAIANNHFHVVKWLLEWGWEIDPYWFETNASCCSTEMLEWIGLHITIIRS